MPLLPASLAEVLAGASLAGGDLDLTNPALLALLGGAGIAVPGGGGGSDSGDAAEDDMGEAMLDDEDEDANVDQLFREARKNAMQTNNEEYYDEEE